MSDLVEAVADAIEKARCPHREGPFGGYDYGYNTEFYGPEPEGGRYVIRDFRDPASPTWGKWLHQSHDCAEHERILEKMTREHVARAAIAVVIERCAKVAEDETWPDRFVAASQRDGNDSPQIYNDACREIAIAIRKLGESE